MRFRHAAIGLLLVASCVQETTQGKMENLGEAIFFDATLSANANQSCATCHHGDVGWTGPDEQVNLHGSVYEGSIAGRRGNRKPPASAYVTFAPVLALDANAQPVGGSFWDGRATGWQLGTPATDQAQGPFLNPVEQALPDAAAVVSRVCNSPNGALFRELFGAGACTDADAGFADIAVLIAAFEGSAKVSSFSSAYDAYVAGTAPLGDVEQRGLALFEGKAKCARCHTTTPDARAGHALFTDFTFDNLGIPPNPEIATTEPDLGVGGFFQKLAADDSWRTQRYVSPSFQNLRSDELLLLARANAGKQRVPTLRNVDKRPAPDFVKAYGHNGYFKSLESIVHFYNTRDVLPRCASSTAISQPGASSCWPAPEVADNVNTNEIGNLGLTTDEEAAIVAFLRTLSDR